MYVPSSNVPERVKNHYRSLGLNINSGKWALQTKNNNSTQWFFLPGVKWEEKIVNQLPNNNAISFNNFKNGDKAIRYKVGNRNMYMTPASFNGLLRAKGLNMTVAYSAENNTNLFKSPFTREMVKRKNIDFVILKKK